MWISYKIVYIEEEERLGDKIILRFILFKILRESIIIRYREIQKFLFFVISSLQKIHLPSKFRAISLSPTRRIKNRKRPLDYVTIQ